MYVVPSVYDLLLVYFGSVHLSFLDAHSSAGILCLVVVKNHFSHQHHQLMQILPELDHKVSGVACHWHKNIHILTRLEREEDDGEADLDGLNCLPHLTMTVQQYCCPY